jgi:HYR domain
VLHCGSFNDSNAPAIEFNDVVHVSGGARYAGICADRTGTNGNVSVDPGFVGPAAGDYHLASSSALVDLGTNAGVPATDLDGEVRTFDGDGDGLPETDIGADEVLASEDTTPPTLQAPSGIVVDATSPQGAVVTYSVIAADNADPDPSVACSPASGSTFAIGSTAVSCTATDDAGNSASANFTVRVRGAAEQLAALRGEVALLPDEKVGRSLSGKLRDAANALTAGQTSKACSRLAAFVAEVQVHAGTKIPAATASTWVADGNRIRAMIGC